MIVQMPNISKQLFSLHDNGDMDGTILEFFRFRFDDPVFKNKIKTIRDVHDHAYYWVCDYCHSRELRATNVSDTRPTGCWHCTNDEDFYIKKLFVHWRWRAKTNKEAM